MIYLSKAAAKEIERIQNSRKQTDSIFSIGVERGGCCGWHYVFELRLATIEVFDRVYQNNGITIVTDAESYPYLQGLKLDYSEDLMGGSFRFDNPNAGATCSCGQSFSIE